jgi:DNA-binding NtrC family response regulator
VLEPSATTPGGAVVLYVDDEPHNLELFRLQFEGDFAVETAPSAEAALAVLARTPVSVLLTDERMPGGMRGVDLLAQAAQRWPDMVRVIVSAYGDAPRLLAAINLGHAHEYILKPWDVAELRDCVRRAITIATRRRSLAEAASMATHVEADAAAAYGRIVGAEGGLGPALALASRGASAAVPILLTGEHGTGKELVARFIHAESKRSGPFLRVACAHVGADQIAAALFGSERDDVVVRGRLEAAGRGSVYLDDVGALPLPVQAALSQALDEGAFERASGHTRVPLTARVLAATHHAAELGLASALRYHFNIVVPIPPLRARATDIAPLALYFAAKHTRPGETPRSIDDDALTALAAYTWPGNVRELESIIARAVALATGPTLTIDEFTFRLDLPSPAELGPSLREEARTNEALELRRVLLAHGGNLARAARALGMPRTTLLSRAKKLGLLS